MKRYVYASTDVDIDVSMFEGTPFKPDTDTSYYNDFLNTKELEYKRQAKNRDGKIVMMTPEDYFWECSHHGFPKYVSVADLKRGRRANSASLDYLKKELAAGHKFALPYINCADHTQEGLHRMMVLGDLYGWTKKQYPVLVVTPYDQELEDRWNLQKEAYDFKEYDFKKACGWAARHLSDYKSPVPDNFVDSLAAEVIKEVKNMWFVDIDVDVDIDVVEEHQQVKVYLTKYKSYEFEVESDPYTVWLADLFDVDGYYSE